MTQTTDNNANARPKAKKERVVKGAFLRVEVKQWWPFSNMDEQVKRLEAEASQIQDVLDEHKSMEGAKISVEREYEEVCSACGARWEPWEEDGKRTCASCGAEVEE